MGGHLSVYIAMIIYIYTGKKKKKKKNLNNKGHALF